MQVRFSVYCAFVYICHFDICQTQIKYKSDKTSLLLFINKGIVLIVVIFPDFQKALFKFLQIYLFLFFSIFFLVVCCIDFL